MQPAANEPEQPKKPFKPVVSAKLNALFDDHEGLPKPEMSSMSDMQLLENSLVAINELYRRAKLGNDESTDYVFRLSYTTLLLARLAENPSPQLLLIAHCNPIWPTLYSPKRGFLGFYGKELERLEIGKNCQLNVSPEGRWSWQGEARLWAGRIFEIVQEFKTAEQGHKNDTPNVDVIERVEPEMREFFKAACALPPLSKSNAKLWVDKVGWPLILLMTQGQPEKHPKLRTLGTHRAQHTGSRKGFAKPGSKTSESNIRDGIKKLITQALRNMAKHP